MVSGWYGLPPMRPAPLLRHFSFLLLAACAGAAPCGWPAESGYLRRYAVTPAMRLLPRNDPEVTFVSRHETIENRVWKEILYHRRRHAGKPFLIRESGPCEGGFVSERWFTTGTGNAVRRLDHSSVKIRSATRVGGRMRMLM